MLREGDALLEQEEMGWGWWWVHAGAGLVPALLDGEFVRWERVEKEHGHAKD